MRGFHLRTIVVLGVLAFSAPRIAVAQSARTDLVGVWVLDPARSEEPEELTVKPDPSRRVGVRITGGFGPPFGAFGGFGPPRRLDPELTRQAIDAARSPAARLSIVLSGDTVVLGVADDVPYAIVVNGKKTERAWLDGVPCELKASWKGRKLRIERKLANELEFTETWAIDAKSQQLVVTLEVDGPITRRVDAKHVYNRATGSS